MLANDYCVFIPTYKRANNVITYKTLKKEGYTGKIYLVVDDKDPQLDEYKKIYKEKVLVFSKDEISKRIDVVDNFPEKNSVIYARNKIPELAKEVGVKYYLVLDDDYQYFCYRRCFGKKLLEFRCKNLDDIILACFDYLSKTDLIDCFCFSQNGDFIGGADSFESIGGKRKIMNSFFCKTDKPFEWKARMNDDVSTNLYNGQRGKLFFTINDVSIRQKETQGQNGGLTDMYLDLGTYIKSFYSVIVSPNCCKISAMGSNDLRIHHKILWNKSCPKLIRERFKK